MQRAQLFDLAIARAATYLDRVRPGWLATRPAPEEVAAALELWYLRTRFAYRIPLDEVVAELLAARRPSP